MPDVIDLSATEAKAVLEKEKQDRIKACGDEITAALQKYNCSLIPKYTFIGTNVNPEIVILPNDTQPKN